MDGVQKASISECSDFAAIEHRESGASQRVATDLNGKLMTFQ
jgi:hypothetical protein